MPIFGNRRRKPRLAPELDDGRLGKVLKALDGPPSPGLADLHTAQVEQLLTEAGTDWDRRSHRITVLARCTADSGFVRTWASRQPKNADALVLRAEVDLVLGRRTGELADARETLDTCYRAAELEPADPAPWVALLGILRLLRAHSDEVFPVWREAVARDVWNREAHLRMLGYLSPAECGSHMQVLEFVDAARPRMPANAPTVGVELTATLRRHRHVAGDDALTAVMARRHWASAPAVTVLDRAYENWRHPGFLHHAAAAADLNLLAYALVQANRIRHAAEVFPLIDGVVTPWPWVLDGDPLQQFENSRGRALR
ncbi:hypothetical protein ACWGF3_02575 [Streptomyces xanthophaeus]|uniref:hypothetical protein n=1 Tax=Streptomyces xanthophaeus TaxID=67385 RepID=UPI0004CD1069|nr:hypothetical protein [Streptomyces xanthophaeus]